MASDDKRHLVARFETIVSSAIAVTMAHPVASEIDVGPLMTDLAAALAEMKDRPAELLPMLQPLQARLRLELASAPDEIYVVASDFHYAEMSFRPPSMPREIVAFVVQDRLASASRRCQYGVAEARYQSLRKASDPCDCAARVEASFFYEPLGPLKLLDSVGVPHVAMDYLWLCEACGTKWFKDEMHDDGGAHETWRLAPPDAERA